MKKLILKTRNKLPLNPVTAFQKCPSCGSRDLLKLEIDVLCNQCSWDSCEAYVEAGGMNNLYAAYSKTFRVRGVGLGHSKFRSGAPTVLTVDTALNSTKAHQKCLSGK